jgi:DNA-binding NarL/FixJ family response regulator
VLGNYGGNDEWFLVDGRNRLAACKLAGITPAYRIVEADADKLKSLVWSWNGPRRHLSSSQKAMAYAMMYPNAKFGRPEKVDKNQPLSERPDLDKAIAEALTAGLPVDDVAKKVGCSARTIRRRVSSW